MSKQTDLINVTDAITVSGSNVGIGTVPSGNLTSGYNLRLDGGAQTYLSFNNDTHTTQVTGGFVIGNDNGAARITQRENQPIIIGTNNAERMRVTAAGSVGINTSSSDSYYAKKLVVDCGTDGQNGITIKSSTTGAGMFAFADGTSGSDRYRGYINYNHANDSMTLGTAGGAGILGIDATGAVTMPTQPAFLVKPASNQENIAINADTTIVFGTEIFDQNADFASNTFTAPVAGKYQFNISMTLTQLDTSTQYVQLFLVTSNRTIPKVYSFQQFSGDITYWGLQTSALVDMDASDTCIIQLNLHVSGTAQTDVQGNYTMFSGYLVA